MKAFLPPALAALMAWAGTACKREAPPPPPPPAAVAGAAAALPSDSAGSPDADDAAEEQETPTASAFVILQDTTLPEPTEENPVDPMDFYDSLAMALDSADPVDAEGNLQVTEGHDSGYAKLLATGTYHGNEVPDDVDRHEWLGAYIDSGSCRMRRTRIRIEGVPDPTQGEEGDTSGKKVSTVVAGKTEFLVRGIAGLKAGPCDAMNFTQMYVGPRKRLTFRYLDTEYVLAGTRHKATPFRSPEGYATYISRLLLIRKTPEGDSTASILRWDWDATLFLNRLGDFDGDGLPDLLLEMSGSNSATTSLYLSHPAEPGRMLKRVAYFSVTGC